MPFPEVAIASQICVQNITAKNLTKQNDEKNPKMTMKRQNKKEQVGERVGDSEVFAQRFALAEHEVRQLQTEEAELNFHYRAPFRAARDLPRTTQRGGHSCTPAMDHTSCTLAKGLVNWWDVIPCALYKLASC